MKNPNIKEPNLIFTRLEKKLFEGIDNATTLNILKNFELQIKAAYDSAPGDTSNFLICFDLKENKTIVFIIMTFHEQKM